MDKNVLEFVKDLLTQYEHSASFREEEAKRSIAVKFKRGNLFDKVFISSDSTLYKEPALKELRTLQSNNLIDLVFDRRGDLEKIVLNIKNVDKLYQYAGLSNPKKYLNELVEHLTKIKYEGVPKLFVDSEINYIKTNFKNRKTYYESIQELDSILLVIDKIYKLDGEVMERDFSSEVLGDSKLFKPLANKVARIIKDFDESIHDTYENNDDLFTSFGLVKNYTYAMMKNNLVFSLNDQIIDLNKLGYEYLLDDKMIKSLKIISGTFNKVITVENLTSFHKLDEKDALIIYLAGFHNHTKQMLLKKIHQVFPNVNYYHWSDIDVGGFRIFNSLKTKTGINFIPYKMSVHELQRKDINFKPLEVNDIKSLKAMLIDPQYQIFHEAISYMLENNIKLEQENLD